MNKSLRLLIMFACMLSIWQAKSQTAPTSSLIPVSSPTLTPFVCGNERIYPYNPDNPASINSFVSNWNAQRKAYLNNPSPQSGNYVIPVVVHILYDTPSENISYNQVQWAIAALNAAYQNNYPSYNGWTSGPLAVNTQIQFCLAQNPMGTSWTNSNEPGVMRYNVPASYLSHDMSSAASVAQLTSTTHPTAAYFPYKYYLNIWLVNEINDPSSSTPNSVIGYSNFPNTPGAMIDGVVIRRDAVGDNSVMGNNFPGLNSNFNRGTVLVHEIGHYLNLFHTFHQINSTNPSVFQCLGDNATNCWTDGDLIGDTPPTTVTAVCGPTNTCVDHLPAYLGNDHIDITEDYMSYGGNNCWNTFTNDQSQRMSITLNTAWPAGRADMVSTSNLIATGLQNAFGCCPSSVITAAFTYSAVCNTVTFSNLLPTCNSNASYLWDFGDATTGTGLNPVHTYTAEGIYVVSCQVTGTNGNLVSFNTTVSTQFSSYIVGQSSPNNVVCNGSRQSIYIHFGINVPSVQLTDGSNIVTVNNILYPNSILTETNTVIYTFTATANVTYSLLPGNCNNFPLGTASFTVMDCCPEIVYNGDFELGNTGFASSLDPLGDPNGSYEVAPPAVLSSYGYFPGPFTGNGMLCNGFGTNGSGSYTVCTSGNNTGQEGRVWEQVINGLVPNKTYYVAMEVTRNRYESNKYNDPSGSNLEYRMRVKDGTGNLFNSPVIAQPLITNKNGFNSTVFSYTFATPATVSPTYTFTIYQIENFDYWYYDYLIDNITMKAMNPFTLTVNPAATNALCSGQSITLSASGADTYTWQPGSYTTNSVNITPVSSGIYTVYAANSTSCTVTSTLAITVIPTPTVNLTQTQYTICSGTSVNMTASGAATYTWVPCSVGCNGSSLGVMPLATTIYTVFGQNPGCSTISSKQVTVTVVSTPTVNVVATSTAVCSGQTVTLTASGANNYTWTPGGSNSYSIVVTPGSSTTYTVKGSNPWCSYTSSTSITIISSPAPAGIITPVTNIPICPGQNLTLGTVSNATSFTWMPCSTGCNTSGITVNPTTSTTYSVILGNAACTATLTRSLTVIPAPVASPLTSSFVACSAASSTIGVIPVLGTTYAWQPASGLSNPNIGNPVANPSAYTVYTLTATNNCGSATATVAVYPAGQYCCDMPSVAYRLGTGYGVAVLPNSFLSFTGSGSGLADVVVSGTLTINQNTAWTNVKARFEPGAKIEITPSGSFNLNNCQLFSCSQLWHGIELLTNGGQAGNIFFRYCRVEDMYQGVYINWQNQVASVPNGTQGKISIDNSLFNKNYYSVQVAKCASYGTSLYYPLAIGTTTFNTSSTNTSPGNTLKPSTVYTYNYNTNTNITVPYISFPRSFVGVYLNNMLRPQVLVGDSTSATKTNLFNNLDLGIAANNSNFEVKNNRFTNLTGSTKVNTAATGLGEIGIGVYAEGPLTKTNIKVVVGTGNSVPNSATAAFPLGNSFDGCNKGVLTNNVYYTVAKGNYIYSNLSSNTASFPPPIYNYWKGQSGIWITNAALLDNVMYNNIQNMKSGVYLSHNVPNITNVAMSVSSNSISAPASQGYCLSAIQIEQLTSNTFILNTPAITVQTNTIQNVYKGIVGNNLKGGLYVYNNTLVSVERTKAVGIAPSFLRNGIELNNCYKAVVTNNPNITSTGGGINASNYNLIQGIALTNSNNGAVTCNNTTQTGRCFIFTGNCTNNWSANSMSHSYQGLVISTNGVIGQQGAASGSGNQSANTWFNITNAETYVINTNNVNNGIYFSPLYIKANTGAVHTTPISNLSQNSGEQYILGTGLKVVSGTPITCASPAGGGGSSQLVAKNIQTFDAITSPAVTYPVLHSEFNFHNKHSVYSMMKMGDITSAQATAQMQSFYAANATSSIGKFADVNKAIGDSLLATAQNINNSVAPASNVEQNQKRLNDLLLAHLNDASYQYNATEWQDLLTMANDCILEGNYVIQARNMINTASGFLNDFPDVCNGGEGLSSVRSEDSEVLPNDEKLVFLLYPNPNRGNMVLVYQIPDNTGSVLTLTDVAGRTIEKYDLLEVSGKLQINQSDLKDGVYFYFIKKGSEVLRQDKFIIIK